MQCTVQWRDYAPWPTLLEVGMKAHQGSRPRRNAPPWRLRRRDAARCAIALGRACSHVLPPGEVILRDPATRRIVLKQGIHYSQEGGRAIPPTTPFPPSLCRKSSRISSHLFLAFLRFRILNLFSLCFVASAHCTIRPPNALPGFPTTQIPVRFFLCSDH